MLGAVLQTQMDKNYSGLSLSLQCPWAILMCLLSGLAQALLSMYSNSAILLKSLLFPLIYSSFCRWILSLPLPLTQLSILAWRKKKKLSTNLNHFNLMSSTCMLQNSIRYCFVTVPITCQRHFCLLWLSFLSVFLHNIHSIKRVGSCSDPCDSSKGNTAAGMETSCFHWMGWGAQQDVLVIWSLYGLIMPKEVKEDAQHPECLALSHKLDK